MLVILTSCILNDTEGHRTGPHSPQVEATLLEMDDFVREVFLSLERRNLTNIVDVIILSDHGMGETSEDRLIFLDDILGEDGFKGIKTNDGELICDSSSFLRAQDVNALQNRSTTGWPAAGLRFHPNVSESAMLAKLVAAAAVPQSGFRIYTNTTMPARWHFTNPPGGERVPPFYVMPDVNWAITNHEEFEGKMKGVYRPKGAHGYDNLDVSLRVILNPFSTSNPFKLC